MSESESVGFKPRKCIFVREVRVFSKRKKKTQTSAVVLASRAQVGVAPFQVLYVAEINRFSTGYVTTVAAEAWGIGYLRRNVKRVAQPADSWGKGRWSFTCPKISHAATSWPLHIHFSLCILMNVQVLPTCRLLYSVVLVFQGTAS